MNRTLRRPMFRIGGVAEGITSGLSRQGYHGTEDASDQRVQPFRSRNFNDFLINMGLDLVSRPKGGNIFQQVATSARGPFKEFQAARAAGEEKRQFGLEMEQEKYLGELAAKGKNEFKKEQIDKYWDKKIADAPPAEHADMEANRQKDIYDIVIHGADISDKYKILSNQSATYMAQGLAEDAILKETNKVTGKKWTKDDDGYAEALLTLYKKYLKITAEFMSEEEK